MADRDPTQRFGDRVADYVRYRPGYPPALFEALETAGVLTPGATVVDLGAGTGLLTAPLLDRGYTVVAVEPNDPMRAAADHWLGDHDGYRSVPGRAEATRLPDASADAALAAQAFHWFDPAQTAAELRRVLRPPHRVALIWNRRRTTGSPFAEGYEALLHEHATDYQEVDHRHAEATARAWFADGTLHEQTLYNAQRFDHDGLAGRVRSSSYMPAPGDPAYEPTMAAVRALFERCQDDDGHIAFEYDLMLYAGRI